MKLYLPITVDLYNIYPLSIMNVQQYNIGRGALVTLTAAGQVVVPNKESLYVYAKKKDGTIAYATCTLSGNQIKIDYDEQMTAIVGTMTVELQMVDENGNSITTPIFQVNIQPSNIDYKKVTSSDEFLALVDALNNVNSFQNQINELNEKLGKVYAGNLNDFVETGIYWLNYNGSTNLPGDRAGALMVISNSDHSYLVQFFGDTVDRYFIRHKEGNNWSAWKEYTTKSYIDNKFLIIDKLFTFPEGTTTRGTLNGDKGSIDNKGKTLINYSVLGVNSGSEFHVQNMVVNLDGSYSVIYDKQGANSFNARISMLFI